MGLRLFLLPNFPGATFIQGGTFITESRVYSGLNTNEKFWRLFGTVENVWENLCMAYVG